MTLLLYNLQQEQFAKCHEILKMTWQQLSNQSGFTGVCSSSTGLGKREGEKKKHQRSVQAALQVCGAGKGVLCLLHNTHTGCIILLGHEKLQMPSVFWNSLNPESQGHL